MADTITLATADDPPKILTHSRAILAAHSTVFRDLFSLPTSAAPQAESTCIAPSINIAESEAEIAPFLSNLTGELGGESVLSDAQWISVARLVDKYDSPVARVFVENMVRSCTKDESAALALTLATYTSSTALRVQCAFRVLDVADQNEGHFDADKVPLSLPAHVEHNLARWKESLYHHALRVGLQHCPDTDYPGVCGDDRCNMGARERAWLEGMRRLAAIDPSQAPLNAPFFPMMDEGEWSPQDFGICSEHVRDFMDPVRWAEYEYRKKAPPFPV
ncbi:hypothetical protein NBRC10512_005272 [Rhodotorula toruloides]|uniref:RHTO0S23e01442g1_1 n=2 Tax=Rhodotorula toruloides TaxID=5286 RepID=A0A061BGQ5_RHOTO|nr:uncharacterized protein RHTO_05898 [Rhodotorula toruloides NP11]EMS18501.1 hypothetical protein RHTO_05898 [Rhodotorula toruloides NP11]CDR49137.1 RHTO0S23e01442g1_1 [Rhodotorula toruloides]